MGAAAIDALLEDQRNVMIGISNDNICYVPFTKAIKNDKPINRAPRHPAPPVDLMHCQGFPEIPSGFVREIESYGSPLTQGLAAALDGEPSVAVRVNPAKGVPDGKWDATR